MALVNIKIKEEKFRQVFDITKQMIKKKKPGTLSYALWHLRYEIINTKFEKTKHKFQESLYWLHLKKLTILYKCDLHRMWNSEFADWVIAETTDTLQYLVNDIHSFSFPKFNNFV